jgi:hypothetical protein
MRVTTKFKKSLVQGVSFSQTESKWLARNQGWYIGRFNTKAEAEAAVLGFTKMFSHLANYFAVSKQLQEVA